MIREQVLHEFAAEGRAVVALEEQRGAMFGEECGQDEGRARGSHIRDGQPCQLATAAQVTHGEDRGINAVDGTWGFTVVNGPHPSGVGPGQPFLADAMRVAIMPAVVALQLNQLAAQNTREERGALEGPGEVRCDRERPERRAA